MEEDSTMDETSRFSQVCRPLDPDASDSEDGMTLAEIFSKFPTQIRSPKNKKTTNRGGSSDKKKKGSSNNRKKKRKRMKKAKESGSKLGFRASMEELAKIFDENRRSSQWEAKKGDLVWAKAFPSTWLPGCIENLNSSVAKISFFGCNETQQIKISEICGFEENYAAMLRMTGVKVFDEMNLALEELSRRTVLGLMCSCRRTLELGANDVLNDQIKEVKREFEPSESLPIVRRLAVSLWVCDEDIVRVVIVSAQVASYRHYVSICENIEIDEGFCPEELLNFVLGRAVCASIDNDKEVRHLNAYRQFVSIRPNWEYRQMVELGFDMIGNGSVSESSLENERDYGISTEPQGDILTETKEEVCKKSQESELEGSHHGRERVYGVIGEQYDDLSVETQEEDYETSQEQMEKSSVICVINTQNFDILGVDDGRESFMNNPLTVVSSSEHNVEMQSNSSLESVVDEEVGCSKIFSDMREVVHKDSGGSLPCNDVNQELEGIAHVEGQNLAFKFETTLENVSKKEDNAATNVDNDVAKLHSLTNYNVVSHRGNDGNNLSASCYPTSRKCATKLTSHQKHHRYMASDSRNWRKFYAASLIENGSNSRKESGSSSMNVNNDVVKLHSLTDDNVVSHRSNDGDHFSASCNSTLWKCATKVTSHQKHHRYVASDSRNWRKFYASPLIENGSNSQKESGSSSMNDRYSSLSKSLHMKFPKNFALPSKQVLEKKFGVFGPLNHSRTKVSFYTGAAQVVFLCHADAYAAHAYAKRKNIFGHANVRYWLDEYEKYRNGAQALSTYRKGHTSLDPKSCLKRPNAILERGNDEYEKNQNGAQILSTYKKGHISLDPKSCLKRPSATLERDKKKKSRVTFSIDIPINSVPKEVI